jgi:hypothetical protein
LLLRAGSNSLSRISFFLSFFLYSSFILFSKIYSVVMVSALALNADATELHVQVYYWATAALVACGAVAWVVSASRCRRRLTDVCV